jgi:hypothetical protein
MKDFWEQSPLWQRKEELHTELDKATKVMEEEGRRVLACVELDADSLHGTYWRERRQAYKDADERYKDAYAAWRAAHKAFDASPVGQAYHRYFGRLRADRIARESALVTEEAAA